MRGLPGAWSGEKYLEKWPAGCAGITKATLLPSASPPTHVQVPELELPPSPPIPEVTTPEPGIYHGICEYPLLGQCQVGGRLLVGEGGLMATWDRVSLDG